MVGSIAVFAGVRYSRRGIVTVQTGHAVRQDLTSLVTASGEIKPRKYINIGANATGELTEIPVKEGDHVRKGQLLARIENTQPAADVNAQRASLSSSEADAAASEAGLKAYDDNLLTMQAGVDRTRADLEKASLDYKRGQELYQAKLIPKQDFDQRKADYDSAQASVKEAEARLTQARAQREQAKSQLYSSQKKVAQLHAMVTRADDVLKKFNSYAPLNGVVTNLPVRVGETVIPGLPNLPGTIIMTIADMSIITAEVKVDETDITTATRQHVVTIPIQALTIRQKGDLEAPPKNATVQAAKLDPAAEKARKEEIQGVFVIAGGKAAFRKVETGITGSTDIEVLSGLKEGDEIVTGSYQVIRTIRNEAQVKIDNKAPLKINT